MLRIVSDCRHGLEELAVRLSASMKKFDDRLWDWQIEHPGISFAAKAGLFSVPLYWTYSQLLFKSFPESVYRTAFSAPLFALCSSGHFFHFNLLKKESIEREIVYPLFTNFSSAYGYGLKPSLKWLKDKFLNFPALLSFGAAVYPFLHHGQPHAFKSMNDLYIENPSFGEVTAGLSFAAYQALMFLMIKDAISHLCSVFVSDESREMLRVYGASAKDSFKHAAAQLNLVEKSGKRHYKKDCQGFFMQVNKALREMKPEYNLFRTPSSLGIFLERFLFASSLEYETKFEAAAAYLQDRKLEKTVEASQKPKKQARQFLFRKKEPLAAHLSAECKNLASSISNMLFCVLRLYCSGQKHRAIKLLENTSVIAQANGPDDIPFIYASGLAIDALGDAESANNVYKRGLASVMAADPEFAKEATPSKNLIFVSKERFAGSVFNLKQQKDMASAAENLAKFRLLPSRGGYYPETRAISIENIPGISSLFLYMKKAYGLTPSQYLPGHPEKSERIVKSVLGQAVCFDNAFKEEIDGMLVGEGVYAHKIIMERPFASSPYAVRKRLERILVERVKSSGILLDENACCALLSLSEMLQKLMAEVPIEFAVMDYGEQNVIIPHGYKDEIHSFDFDDNAYGPFFREAATFYLTLFSRVDDRTRKTIEKSVQMMPYFAQAYEAMHSLNVYLEYGEKAKRAELATIAERGLELLGYSIRDARLGSRNAGSNEFLVKKVFFSLDEMIRLDILSRNEKGLADNAFKAYSWLLSLR